MIGDVDLQSETESFRQWFPGYVESQRKMISLRHDRMGTSEPLTSEAEAEAFYQKLRAACQENKSPKYLPDDDDPDSFLKHLLRTV